MRNVKVLEMINAGRIEELKILLQDEIYAESLKATPGTKKRYTAMKRYFTYVNQSRECLQKPCTVEFEGKKYTSFTNSWSLVLTTENPGEIELFNEENGRYPDVTRLIKFGGLKKKIDFNKIIAEAKSKGYRLNKSEVNHNFKYLMYYDETYYKIGLIDITYSIINNGEVTITHHPGGPRSPLTIENELGVAIVMPVKFEDEPDDSHIVINVD